MKGNTQILVIFALTLPLLADNVAINATDSITSDTIEQLRQTELRILNLFRSLHDCPPLLLNDSLNQAAQNHSELLYSNHSYQKSTEALDGLYGQNLYWAFGIPDLNYQAGSAIINWYSYNVYYNYTSGKPYNDVFQIDSFTAQIWKNVTSVGFGFSGGPQDYYGLQGNAIYVVANFYPPPNLQGKFIENISTPK